MGSNLQKRLYLVFSITCVVNSSVFAADEPKFEVASVKKTAMCGGGGSVDPGVVVLQGVPLKPVLMEAFKVKIDQIEGPSWLETDCFDISAKIPSGVTRDAIPAMLQTLLSERFKLVAHKQDRVSSGYGLLVDKGGPKFKEDNPNGTFMGRDRGMMYYSSALAPVGALKGVMSMATLAANLSSKGFGPVQDLTGLNGKYEIDLRWASNTDVDRPEPDLFTALRESLGLRLERRNVQIPFIVIDSIERIPTEN